MSAIDAERGQPSEGIVGAWLTQAAESLSMKKAGLAIWTRGSDHKVVAALARSRWGDAYLLRLLVFFDARTRSVAQARADADLHSVLQCKLDLFAFDLCLDFERPDISVDLRRQFVVATLCAKIGPLMRQVATRQGLLDVLKETNTADSLPIWTRQTLGLA